ncbi:hypothetical protein CEXT_22731 [Caerostris extrusa]|uniref:Uncharacterized protein n=1 Tax=Caerostris extrusa TaxID=172846 RepID=A0AAV4VDA5_CAEEX|nr:hypothetical protein CEXT_22731 [Caerostris extrusa]
MTDEFAFKYYSPICDKTCSILTLQGSLSCHGCNIEAEKQTNDGLKFGGQKECHPVKDGFAYQYLDGILYPEDWRSEEMQPGDGRICFINLSTAFSGLWYNLFQTHLSLWRHKRPEGIQPVTDGFAFLQLYELFQLHIAEKRKLKIAQNLAARTVPI